MSNTYFQFKQFRINQDQSAMKVATDACILGAVTPVPEQGAVLDIGTGTGLLSLMIAQRCDCSIDAVELDEKSFKQAEKNVIESPWSHHIKVHHADIRSFHASQKYDLVICNPPFYENHLRSISAAKNTAKHAAQLSFEELVDAIKRNLKPDGIFSVLLPANMNEKFTGLCETAQLNIAQQVLIRDNEAQDIIRIITFFSFKIQQKAESILLTIKDAAGNYSPQFTQLLNPYYLHL